MPQECVGHPRHNVCCHTVCSFSKTLPICNIDKNIFKRILFYTYKTSSLRIIKNYPRLWVCFIVFLVLHLRRASRCQPFILRSEFLTGLLWNHKYAGIWNCVLRGEWLPTSKGIILVSSAGSNTPRRMDSLAMKVKHYDPLNHWGLHTSHLRRIATD